MKSNFKRLQKGLILSILCACAFLYEGQDALGQSSSKSRQNKSQSQSTTKTAASAEQMMAPACGEELLSAADAAAKLKADPPSNDKDPMSVPAGRYALLPDHGIAAYMPGNDQVNLRYFRTDKDSKLDLGDSTVLGTYPANPHNSGMTQIFATTGHILSAGREDMITATREGNASAAGVPVAIRFRSKDSSADQFSVQLPESLLPRQRNSSDFIAIASGDLDGEADANGDFHDEVVVARVTGESGSGSEHYYGFRVDVLNYSGGNISSPEISSAPNFADYAADLGDGNTTTLASDNIISLAVGDFTGDGHKEIALVMLGRGTLIVNTFRYERENGAHVLKRIGIQFWPVQNMGIPGELGGMLPVGTIAAAAGDFAGIGSDQLAVAYAKFGKGNYGVGVLIFKYDADHKLQLKNANWQRYPDTWSGGNYESNTRPRVQLVAGQFLLVPPDIQYGRKQLVMAINRVQSNVNLTALSVSKDMSAVTQFANFTEETTAGAAYSLSAGHFQGAAGSLPVASLALGAWAGSNSPSTYKVTTYYVNSNSITRAGNFSTTINQAAVLSARLPLVAFDLDGNSRYLGPPVHLTIGGVVQTDSIMQEPPKHAYWDNRSSQHKIVNLTRFDGSNVELSTSKEQIMETSSKDHAAMSVGGSVALSAGVTGTAGGNWGILKAETSASVDVTVSAKYDYSEVEESYKSQAGSHRTESSGKTDRDDYLRGVRQTYDVWRYRIYGTPKSGDLNAFYEIVLPGPTMTFFGAGKSFPFYQPIHENGNILTYPSALGFGDPDIPRDIGPFEPIKGKDAKTEPLVPAAQYYFDETSHHDELHMTDSVKSGSSFSYSHEIGASEDIRATYTADVKTPAGGGQVRGCGSAELHQGGSWGGTATSDATTTTNTTIRLNRTAGASTTGYPFSPVMYATKDGAIKMAFRVPDPTDRGNNYSGAAFFAGWYGVKPDPALNLPNRLTAASVGSGELETWQPTMDLDRKKMRGLFFRQAERDASGAYPLINFSPKDGDIVRIEPRVYNLSTAQPAVNTVVEYQAIPYDSATNSEVCDRPINGVAGQGSNLVCPRSARTIIGKTQIGQLGPRQFTCVEDFDRDKNSNLLVPGCTGTAAFNWNTHGFGPSTGSARDYRVYVVLNPGADPSTELYGAEPDPLPVASITNTTPVVVTVPGHKFATGDYVAIGNVPGLEQSQLAGRITLIDNNPDQFTIADTSYNRNGYSGGGLAWVIDPGQNNEGFGYITIARPAGSVAQMTAEELHPKDYIQNDALEAISNGSRITAGRVQAHVGERVQLRFTVHSTAAHHEQASVYLYEADPRTGAPAIASEYIHPGSHGPQGSSVWFTWTPTKQGVHHLYAALDEIGGDNGLVGQLEVDVQAPQARKSRK